MTIAICSVSPEGVVFGADSTASATIPGTGFHYLNHNQKLFEIGEPGTLGAITWGRAALGNLSHRTLLARLSDQFLTNKPTSVEDACNSWIDLVWPIYQRECARDIGLVQTLHKKLPYSAVQSPPPPNMRTEKEEKAYNQLRLALCLGFCIGGRCSPDRLPYAYEMIFDPLSTTKPGPVALRVGETRCWGAPKIFHRMVSGIDGDLLEAIVKSGKWTGTVQDLAALLPNHRLEFPGAPIRDVVDFVHSCIVSTIKTLKYSPLSQVCGGPIEIAVVTTDRCFRWVRHKDWDVAIKEGHNKWMI